jgi:hypothetical protein
MFAKKKKPTIEEQAFGGQPFEDKRAEGEATGRYRIVLAELSKNLEQKKATRSSVERIIRSVDTFAQKHLQIPKTSVKPK